MNRRRFLTGAAALIGGLALEQAIPLGRVWSFPSRIRIADKGITVSLVRTIEGNQFYVYPTGSLLIPLLPIPVELLRQKYPAAVTDLDMTRTFHAEASF